MDSDAGDAAGAAEQLASIKSALGASDEDLARWVGDGAGPAGAPARGRRAGIAQLARLAETLTQTLIPGAVRVVFAERAVALLGGLTYRAALERGWDVDVLVDVVRRGVGREPLTDAGRRFLAGSTSAAPASR